MRYPLVESDGNIGSQEGNGFEAAARYTNSRPSKFADLMMEDFDKNTVPLKETYNGEYLEPVVLPSFLPNAIVNGRETIAIGLAHNSLPNNLSEACDALIAYLRNENMTVDQLLEYMPGPDFPLGGVVINKKDIRTAFATGKSAVSLKVRGDYEIKGQNIIFTSIPYRTYRDKIKEQIEKNVDTLAEYIEDFNDESNVGVNRLVFQVKKGVDPEKAVLKLFALTDLQTSLSYNMNYIVDGTPKMCSMLNLFKAYINHQHNVLINAAEFDRDKAEKRKHIIEGLLIAIEDIDTAIALIRSSKDRKEAEVKLVERFRISEIQSKAILDMKLAKLTKLDKDELLTELKSQIAIIEECDKIINEVEYRIEILIYKLTKLKNDYGDERRTKLIQLEILKEEKIVESTIAEDCVVIMTQTGNIKRVPTNSFKVQRRSEKGVKTLDDAILDTISTNTMNTLMLFSNKGKAYSLLVDKIPQGAQGTKGSSVNSLIKLDVDEKIIRITSLENENQSSYIIFVTKQGLVKKTKLSEYSNGSKRSSGVIAIKLKETDSIVTVMTANDEDIALVTKRGFGICFKSKEISAQGRVAMGAKGISLSKDDEVVAGFLLKDRSEDIAIFNEAGTAYRFSSIELLPQARGGRGIKVGTENTVDALPVNDKDNLLITGVPNSICISAKEIPLLKRIATGNLVIKNSRIKSVAKL